MSEKLTIRNFGPIETIENLIFNTITIFIGDQGTGKSTIAKVLTVILETHFTINENYAIFSKNAVAETKKNYKELFLANLRKIGIENYLKTDSYLSFKNSKGEEIFVYGDGEIKVFDELNEFSDTLYIAKAYIPAYREAAILLQDSLYALMRTNTKLPDILSQFGQLFNDAKKLKNPFNYNKILGIGYRYDGNDIKVILKDKKEILMEEASSAINSTLPLLLVYDYLNWFEMQTEGNSFKTNVVKFCTIEEPELNCYPETQRKVIYHLVDKLGKVNDFWSLHKKRHDVKISCLNRMIITTHSPYTLTTLNNLMYAYQIGQQHESEVINIVDRKYWINPEDVSAYMLIDGTFENILDKEEKLIKAEKIDDVSGILNEQFDALLNIEFVEK